MALQIRLFGAFSITEDDAEVYAVHGSRQEPFLAYLLLHTHAPQSRRQMAFAFWPDSTEAQSLGNLRKVLHELRQVWPEIERFLRIDTRTLHWRSDGPFVLDVATFDELLAQAEEGSHHPATERGLLEDAVALYRGDLLPNCYDDWILPIRERLRHAFQGALERLIGLAESEQDYAAAIAHANHLLRYEPTQETIYRRLMQLHLLLGDRAAALNVYHTCATALQRELDVSPGQEMQADYARLLEAKGLNGASASQSRQTRTGAVARLVGREGEWAALHSAWKRATAGGVYFCLIRGEAGIGKSRLAQTFLQWVRDQGGNTAQSRAYQMQRQLAYTSAIDWLDAPVLGAAMPRLDDGWLTELARLLPALLSERPELPRPEALRDGRQRQRIFAALTRVIFAAQQPLVLFLDDAQWCDRETLEFLHFLLEKGDGDSASSARTEVLVLCTARSEELDEGHPLSLLLAALGRTDKLTEIELAPLSPGQTKEMAAQLHRNAISPQVARALFAYTEGNPLYIVETLADEGWEEYLHSSPASGGAQPLNGGNGALPAKIYATIRERLSHLSDEARQLASLAAVIGRGFDFETLNLAGQVAEDRAMRSLDELWRRGIVAEEAGGSYDFSHDRIRDVVYAEIGPVQRPLLHRRVAQALEARHTGDPDSVSGQIAHHYEEARGYAAAIRYYMRAAARAEKLYIVEQTHTYLDKALELLAAEPETPTTINQQLDCLLSKDYALRQTKGQISEAGRDVLNRAYRLAAQLNDPLRLMDVLLPLRSFYGSAGDWREAGAIIDRLVTLAEEVGDPKYLEWANSSAATVCFFRGEFQKAACQYKRDAVESNQVSYRYSLVPGSRAYLANLRWLFGYPDQARSQALDAIRTGDAYVDPCLRIQVREKATQVLRWIDERAQLGIIVRELAELCAAFGYADMGFPAPFLTHWLAAEEGAAPDGIADMQNALEEYIAQMMTYKESTYFLTIIAESQAKAGLPEAALESLARARQLSDKWGERFWLAEIHRLTGEMQQRLGRPEEAVEAALKEALDVARQQGAKSLELRAATSLARFWQEHGRQTEAHSLLAGIYDWFSEGFDTPDLQAAQSLLDSLAS